MIDWSKASLEELHVLDSAIASELDYISDNDPKVLICNELKEQVATEISKR